MENPGLSTGALCGLYEQQPGYEHIPVTHETQVGLVAPGFGLEWPPSETQVGLNLSVSLPRGSKDGVLLTQGAQGESSQAGPLATGAPGAWFPAEADV